MTIYCARELSTYVDNFVSQTELFQIQEEGGALSMKRLKSRGVQPVQNWCKE